VVSGESIPWSEAETTEIKASVPQAGFENCLSD
jgi:hypothetical protein